MRQNNPLISIIIPNYNNSKFIIDCLESIVSQKYKNKEIIIIDDGSTDDSIEKIKKYMKKHNKVKMKLLQQKNSGATVARNKGIEQATGKYAIFLDSDDMLSLGILSKMMQSELLSDSDLLVGGYTEINENGTLLSRKFFAKGREKVDVKKSFAKLINIDPAPSNKIYNLDIIKKYNLKWNKVRIAQDLDFYFRYLALCDKATIVEDGIYQYRFTFGSISRTYDFRIFDIVKVFLNVKEFYRQNGMIEYYDEYMPFQVYRHFNFQLSKQIFFKDRDDRKKIVEYFLENEDKIGSEDLCNKFHHKLKKKNIITSGIYCTLSRWILTLKKKVKCILKPTIEKRWNE